ncbi:MAG: Sau3AI family type II restriction endonuclease [Syntrophomonadaceae bacterium]|nr:Sau3AI family type II restriction endonuclease [Syntrophomonadaceae bacterium]
MQERKYKTKEEVLARGKEAIGVSFKYIDKTNRLTTGKGAIGSVMEESWFGYCVNSQSAPDFIEAGVELKVTPYLRTRKGIRAKERLVCNSIDYMTEYQKSFWESSFWYKCNTILIMSYEHINNVPKGDFKVDEVVLFNFPEKDLIIIERDWKIIIDKIKEGRAHEISEGDTLYLGASTKGATAKSVRKQPFSNIEAKKRAYALKQSYMTYILNTHIFGGQQSEKIIKNPAELKTKGFEEYLKATINPYLGKTQAELKKIFGIESKAKNINELILAKMLGVEGKISKTEEFQKANIVTKTISIQRNGSIKENMSFSAFKFKEIAKEKWDNSTLKNYLEQTRFLFIIFKADNQGGLVFYDLIFWNMPEVDLNEVGRVWMRTLQKIQDGIIFSKVNNVIHNDLPKKTESTIAHVRPHSARAAYKFGNEIIGNLKDANELPDGRWMTTQCFWLNNDYILKQITKALGKKE